MVNTHFIDGIIKMIVMTNTPALKVNHKPGLVFRIHP